MSTVTKPKIGQWVRWDAGGYPSKTMRGILVADLGDEGCLVSVDSSARGEDDWTGRPVVHLRYKYAEDLEFAHD